LAATPEDDGFREIQLNGKQLVFLFMAITVVSVVIFLSGVLVGRGVRAERVEAVQSAASDAAVATPARTPTVTSDDDPRKAAPPAPAGEEVNSPAPPVREPIDEPPVAVNRTPTPAAAPPKPVDAPAPKAADKPAAKAPAPPPAPVASAPAVSPASTPTAGQVATAAVEDGKALDGAADVSRAGYAVQVAAVNARNEADAIVKRLASKGYSAYVEDPIGQVSMYRVRVGTFKTRREAQTTADRLRKEEKFKPWVTR
jgi:DedD protein